MMEAMYPLLIVRSDTEKKESCIISLGKKQYFFGKISYSFLQLIICCDYRFKKKKIFQFFNFFYQSKIVWFSDEYCIITSSSEFK